MNDVNARAVGYTSGGERPYGSVNTFHPRPNSVPLLHTVNNFAEWTGEANIRLRRTLRMYDYEDYNLTTPMYIVQPKKRLDLDLYVKIMVKRRRSLTIGIPNPWNIPLSAEIGGGHKIVVVADDFHELRHDPVPDFEVRTTPQSTSYWRTHPGYVVRSMGEVDGEFAGDELLARQISHRHATHPKLHSH